MCFFLYSWRRISFVRCPLPCTLPLGPPMDLRPFALLPVISLVTRLGLTHTLSCRMAASRYSWPNRSSRAPAAVSHRVTSTDCSVPLCCSLTLGMPLDLSLIHTGYVVCIPFCPSVSSHGNVEPEAVLWCLSVSLAAAVLRTFCRGSGPALVFVAGLRSSLHLSLVVQAGFHCQLALLCPVLHLLLFRFRFTVVVWSESVGALCFSHSPASLSALVRVSCFLVASLLPSPVPAQVGLLWSFTRLRLMRPAGTSFPVFKRHTGRWPSFSFPCTHFFASRFPRYCRLLGVDACSLFCVGSGTPAGVPVCPASYACFRQRVNIVPSSRRFTRVHVGVFTFCCHRCCSRTCCGLGPSPILVGLECSRQRSLNVSR